MGLFSMFSSASKTAATYTPQNEQEAWVAIMYACMSADGNISDAEINRLVNQVGFKNMFRGHDIVTYYKRAMIAGKDVGGKQLIDSSASQVAENNRLTLFALTIELLLADGVLGNEEKEIAEYLMNALRLSEASAQKIVEVMLIRNQGNMVFA